jgi:EmrB/QacA subfamily drug resistance transporter
MTTESMGGLPSNRRLNVLSIVLVIGAITSILDTTIVNVALDRLHVIFRASVADTQWVSTGYLLALAGIIPLTGWAAQRFGAKRVWLTAISVFLLGSVLCGFAWDLPSLIGFRVLQGLGGGMILPVTFTILIQAAGPSRISRTMSYVAFPAQLGPIFGPIIGGTIIDSINWNWLFFVNVPLCVIAIIAGSFVIPGERGSREHAFDFRGFLLLTPALVALVYGIRGLGGAGGIGEVHTWLPLAVGVVLLVSFVLYATRARRTPLIDVRLFTKRSFGLTSAITFLSGFSTFAAMLLLPLFYQEVRGDSAITTGLLLIPQGVGTMVFLLIQGQFTKRFDVRWIIAGGVVLSMIGLLPFLGAGDSGHDALLLVGQFIRGIGVGASAFPIMTVAFASLERSAVPSASAAFNVVQRVGAPFGTAVVAIILEHYLVGSSTSGAVSLAFTSTFWWVIAFSVLPLVLSFFLPSTRKATVTATESVDDTTLAVPTGAAEAPVSPR